MVTALRKMPPPPPIAQNDPVFNRWLHDLMAFIKEGGFIDPGVIPGYDVLVSTVHTHTTQISSLTIDVASLTSQVGVHTSQIASLFSITSLHTTEINLNAANIALLFDRPQVRNGIVAPVAALGSDGDWFADTVAKHIYVRTGGTWVLIV